MPCCSSSRNEHLDQLYNTDCHLHNAARTLNAMILTLHQTTIFLDWFKLKAFADKKKGKCGKKRKNILGKGEIAGYQHFLHFPKYFLNSFPYYKFYNLPNSKSLQTTISNLMKKAERSPNG